MSRKGVSNLGKSRQIPRIFQRRNASISTTIGRPGWIAVDGVAGAAAAAAATDDVSEIELRASPEVGDHGRPDDDDDDDDDDERNSRRESIVIGESAECPTRSWSCQDAIVATADGDAAASRNDAAETVADIEKWLKTRTESVSSIDLETMKSEVGEEEEEEGGVGVERYLADDLPHAFLGKDPDGLSIDIDLSDKKLHLGYDPILQELQSDKLLEACEKNDDFILPEFRLDHLDPMTLSPEAMMVAGEILPSTSSQPGVDARNAAKENHLTIKNAADNETSMDLESEELSDKPIQSDVYELTEELEELEDFDDERDFNNKNAEGLTSEISNAEFSEIAEVAAKTRPEVLPKERPRGRSKTEPRIMKRRAKLVGKGEKNQITFMGEECHIEGKDGIMAVVAISTDNISNMTQIVINTGKDEQIYQGKTSELIEATGNFPKLPRIDAAGSWSNGAENGAEGAPSTQHEMIISNALEELGITDECLQPTTTSEHGRTWLCPRDDCNREFNKIYALKGHLLAHYGVRPFKCDYEGCAWAFHSEFKLKRHRETHLKRKDFVCAVPGCARRFTTVYNLWSHEKLHTRPNRVTCQVPNCQEKFQTKRALELHMKSHDQSHAPYVCQHEGCGKRYYSSNALTSHQRCHSYKEIDVKCSWAGCGKVFDKPCRLKAHIRTHTGCKPYPCTYQDCHWAFSSSSKLKRHEKKHTNERKFVCDVEGCGKAFMRSEHLKEHRLTHKEGRYFECYMCDACFSAKSSLYVHIKKHQIKEAVDTITTTTTPAASCRTTKRRSRESRVASENLVAAQQAAGVEEASRVTNSYEDRLTMQGGSAGVEGGFLTRLTNAETSRVAEGEGRDDFAYDCGRENRGKSGISGLPGGAIDDCDKSTIGEDANAASLDYVLYAAPGGMAKVGSQMIMVEPGDTIILNATPETVECPPEPEPPPPRVIEKVEKSFCRAAGENLARRANQGAARTGLTREDVWRMKASGTTETVVGASDVVLGTADLTEGLLLTEELPSMYYQDDLVGTECQILLLDSGTPESAISLRGLE